VLLRGSDGLVSKPDGGRDAIGVASSELEAVPLGVGYAKTAEQRTMPATFMENKQVIVFVTSAERPRTLQQAFIDTLRGSQFLADAENAKRARAVDGSGIERW
jgi:hypothetical protein